MKRVFENTLNGHRETTGIKSGFVALVLGPVGFVIQGAWSYAVFEAALFAACLLIPVSGLNVVLAITVWCGFAWGAPWTVAESYLQRGWRDVIEGSDADAQEEAV